MNTLPIKIDFHVHTCYSHDCTTTLEEVIFYSKRKGLSGVAITDHDTVEGSLRLLKKSAGLIIIPGIEVSTIRGHVLGVNVITPIPPRLSVKETVNRIHEAGGIAIAAHPSAILKDDIGLGREITSYGLDAVEVVNSSAFPFFLLNDWNRRFAKRMGLPQTAGSDSHLPETIGLAYTSIESVETDPDIGDIVEAVKKGMTVPFGKPTPWRLRLRKIMQKRK